MSKNPFILVVALLMAPSLCFAKIKTLKKDIHLFDRDGVILTGKKETTDVTYITFSLCNNFESPEACQKDSKSFLGSETFTSENLRDAIEFILREVAEDAKNKNLKSANFTLPEIKSALVLADVQAVLGTAKNKLRHLESCCAAENKAEIIRLKNQITTFESDQKKKQNALGDLKALSDQIFQLAVSDYIKILNPTTAEDHLLYLIVRKLVLTEDELRDPSSKNLSTVMVKGHCALIRYPGTTLSYGITSFKNLSTGAINDDYYFSTEKQNVLLPLRKEVGSPDGNGQNIFSSLRLMKNRLLEMNTKGYCK